MNEADKPFCKKCRHIFYSTVPSDLICHYCKSEPQVKCVVCGQEAECTGYLGYICRSQSCLNTDSWAEQANDSRDNDEY